MGWGHGSLILKNPRRPDLQPVAVEALADPGAWHLCIPEAVRIHLALEAIDSRDVTRADGTKTWIPYVGPIEVRFKHRVGCTGALVMGDQVVLGAIPLADMDLVIRPTTRTADVNPDSPNIGISWAKCTPHRVRAGTVPLGRSRPRCRATDRRTAQPAPVRLSHPPVIPGQAGGLGVLRRDLALRAALRAHAHRPRRRAAAAGRSGPWHAPGTSAP
jgi:clan AA aspartic protease